MYACAADTEENNSPVLHAEPWTLRLSSKTVAK